jgi:hypothetical protein
VINDCLQKIRVLSQRLFNLLQFNGLLANSVLYHQLYSIIAIRIHLVQKSDKEGEGGTSGKLEAGFNLTTQIGDDMLPVYIMEEKPQLLSVPKGQIYLLTRAKQPGLEILEPASFRQTVPFTCIGKGREPDEALWLAEPELSLVGEWQFRLQLEGESNFSPDHSDFYKTTLHHFWLQDGQIFDQRATETSPLYLSTSRL